MKRHHPRSGFTLIELLIALVLTGLVGALVLDFVMAQGRFGARQAAVQEVQQNARGALELIVSELRGVPPGSVVSVGSGDPSTLQFRAPLAWGVVCDPEPSAPIVSFPIGMGPQDLPSGWGLDVPDPDNEPNGRIAVSGGGAPSTGIAVTCDDAGDGGELWRIPLAGSVVVQFGTPVFLYQTITYTVAGGTDKWLTRNAQPLAGPVREFRVRYNPPSGASSAAGLSRVEVKIAAESRSKVQNGQPVVETDSMVVFLRNRS